MTTIYETARKLRIPGMVIHAHVDPKLLTPRIRNAAIRMIDKGIVAGHGQAAKLARMLMESCEDAHIRFARHNWRYVTALNCKELPADIHGRLIEASEADRAIRVMELTEELNRRSSEWLARDLNSLKNSTNVRSFRFDPEAGGLTINAKSRAGKELFEPIMVDYLAGAREARSKYITMLEGTEPIPVKF